MAVIETKTMEQLVAEWHADITPKKYGQWLLDSADRLETAAKELEDFVQLPCYVEDDKAAMVQLRAMAADHRAKGTELLEAIRVKHEST